MSLTIQEAGSVGVGVELAACLQVGRPEDLGDHGCVHHGEVGAEVSHVEIWWTPGGFCPVDKPGYFVVLPQRVGQVEVSVQQSVWGGWPAGSG